MTMTSGAVADGTAPVVALIPLRTGGKSRLRTTLSEARRAELVLAMLDDVLSAVRAAGVEDIRVLAGDPAADDAATARGLVVHRDPASEGSDGADEPGDKPLRAAVDAALSAVGARSARLIVAADLPRLCAEEVRQVISDPADVVVAATVGGGTALLRLAPGVTFATHYGPGSARAHLAAADRDHRTAALLDLPGARHDVDAADDLTGLRGRIGGPAPGMATAAFLAGLRG